MSKLQMPIKPWLIVGDFITIYNYDDKLGGKAVNSLEIDDFTRLDCSICVAMLKRKEIGDVEMSYHLAKKEYKQAITFAQADPTNLDLQVTEKMAASRFSTQAEMYRSFSCTAYKITLLQKGDDNNSYFHACIDYL
uniref:Uncharacterized protein n=1 Tax=Cannabis sativa TaxID=3483 RepID=A0A803PCS2_CANSA